MCLQDCYDQSGDDYRTYDAAGECLACTDDDMYYDDNMEWCLLDCSYKTDSYHNDDFYN